MSFRRGTKDSLQPLLEETPEVLGRQSARRLAQTYITLHAIHERNDGAREQLDVVIDVLSGDQRRQEAVYTELEARCSVVTRRGLQRRGKKGLRDGDAMRTVFIHYATHVYAPGEQKR